MSAPGAVYLGGGRCRFRVWAPWHPRVQVRLLDPERLVELDPLADGYHEATVDDVEPGRRYLLRVGEEELPDPASRSQPEGVHGASVVDDPDYPWGDGDFAGVPLDGYVLYELHVGTFTEEGTFGALVPHLPALRELGVTAVEIMPVAQFPGARNWGYDGVFPYAVQSSYGGTRGLKRLVDACHAEGLAVVVDVVYNHLGPEGNVLPRFGPYFSDRHTTLWGDGLNFDGPEREPVREFFVEHALRLVEEFHVDALRLDAVHAIEDDSEPPFLHDLAAAVHERGHERGRPAHLIAESDLRNARLLVPGERGGIGMDAQWNDDFHHAVHALLTGERQGYYRDFGSAGRLAEVLRRAAIEEPSRRLPDVHPRRYVVYAQNHDQIGNRMVGERLRALVGTERARLATALALLSPWLPLIFMGEEYGEEAPFLYFTSHDDAELVEAVRSGRRDEFAGFGWQGEPPDPQDPATFARSRLTRRVDQATLELTRRALGLRRELPVLHDPDAAVRVEVAGPGALAVHRAGAGGEALILLNAGEEVWEASGTRDAHPGKAWQVRLASWEGGWDWCVPAGTLVLLAPGTP